MKTITLVSLLRAVALFISKKADKLELQNKIKQTNYNDRIYMKDCDFCHGTGMTPVSMCGCFCDCWKQNVSIK